MNIIDPKKIPTDILWKLQVPKALEYLSLDKMQRIQVMTKAKDGKTV